MIKNKIEHSYLNKGYLEYEHLLGREFIHGTQDCFSMVRDIFADNTPIKMSNYARPDDWWVESDNSLYMDNFEKEGFVLIDQMNIRDLQPLDCFLIAIPDSRRPETAVANHCAIYVGNGDIVHHRLGKLSQVMPYRHAMRNYTVATVRHRDVPNLLKKARDPKVDLMQYMLPHKRAMLEEALNNEDK